MPHVKCKVRKTASACAPAAWREQAKYDKLNSVTTGGTGRSFKQATEPRKHLSPFAWQTKHAVQVHAREDPHLGWITEETSWPFSRYAVVALQGFDDRTGDRSFCIT